MKTIKRIILIILFMLIGVINCLAASNPYKQAGPYGTNCTWYTWAKAYERAGVALPAWGNAKTWYESARNAGYSVGTTPRSNSVVVWNITSYGHVGYVESVRDGKIYVWDSDQECISKEDENYCYDNSVDESTLRECENNMKKSACEYDPIENVIGYIYLYDAPKTPAGNSTTNTTTNNKSTSTTKKATTKSDNNYIKSITLSTGNIEFKKETLEYTLEVDYKTEKINVSATLEDSKATIKGTGDYTLNVGVNDIKLTVTSENKTERVYTIHVTRKEEEKKESKVVVKKDIKENKSNKKLIILTVSIIAIIIGVVGFLIIKRRRKNK